MIFQKKGLRYFKKSLKQIKKEQESMNDKISFFQ